MTETSDSKSIRGVPSFAQGLKILLVDPDTMSLIQLSSMLEQYSYKVTTTKLASSALSMIEEQKNQFELVMANINMSDMDSYSFLQVLVMKGIPVILMSSERNVHIAKKALAEGACFFLEKPISFKELKYVWQHVYRKRRNPMKKINKIYIGKEPQSLQNREADIRFRPRTEDLIIKELGDITRFPIQYSHNGHMTNDCKRMKINEETKEKKDNTNSSCDKMTRTVWNPELHLKFTAAICALGDKKARPKAILKKMNVPDLTVRQVASHLQKYKAQVQQICRSSTTSPCVTTSQGFLTKTEPPPTSKSHRFQSGSIYPSNKSYGFQTRALFPSSSKPLGFQTRTRFQSSYDTSSSLARHFGQGNLNFGNKGPSDFPYSISQSKTNIGNFAGYDHKSNLYNFNNSNQMNQMVNQIRSRQNFIYNSNMIGDSKGKQPEGGNCEALNSHNWNSTSTGVIWGTTQGLEPVTYKSISIEKFPTNFNELSQNLETINKEAPAVGSSSSQNRPLPFSEYADLLKLLEEDPDEFDCFGNNAADLGDVEKYCEWLRKNLIENSTESQ